MKSKNQKTANQKSILKFGKNRGFNTGVSPSMTTTTIVTTAPTMHCVK